MICERDADNARLRRHPTPQFLEGRPESGGQLLLGHFSTARRRRLAIRLEPRREEIFRAEPWVDRLHAHHLPAHKECRCGEGNRHGHLGDDHDGPHAAKTEPAARRGRFAQPGANRPRDAERRSDTGNHGAEHRQHAGVHNGLRRDAGVEPERQPLSTICLEHLQQPSQPESRNANPGGGRHPAEHQRFDEELRDDSPAARAESGPDEELALARGRPREHQRGHVGGDEHQKEDKEDVDRVQRAATDLETEDRLRVRNDLRAQVGVRARPVSGGASRDAGQLRLRLLDRRRGREPAEHLDQRSRVPFPLGVQ